LVNVVIVVPRDVVRSHCEFLPLLVIEPVVPMTYHFPPPAPPSIALWIIATNLLVMVAALAAAFGLFGKRAPQSRKSFWRKFGIIALSVTAVAGLGLAFDELRVFAHVWLVLGWLVIGPTYLISVAAQASGRQPTPKYALVRLGAGGLLVFLILPMISLAQLAGMRTQCMNNLRQIWYLFPTLQNQAFRYPSMTVEGDPALSWRTRIYTEVRQVEDRVVNDAGRSPPTFDRTKPWNDPANLALAREKFNLFVCPANFNPTDDSQRYFTAYAAVTGPQTAFPGGKALPISLFTDGTSNTIIYGEAAGLKIVWTEPRDIDISREPIGINLRGSRRGESPGALSSYHAGGAVVVFADGSVRFVSQQINPAVLKGLLTATGGEPVTEGTY
jgi:prepilin-type processing-associated H-X9-DG protein